MRNGLNLKTTKHLQTCLENWEKRKGPRVGDYICTIEKGLKRFTHDWDDGLQITSNGNDESFHLSTSGFVSFSGSLEPSIPLEKIMPIGKTMSGKVWVWLDGVPGGGRGVDTWIECRVYQEIQ